MRLFLNKAFTFNEKNATLNVHFINELSLLVLITCIYRHAAQGSTLPFSSVFALVSLVESLSVVFEFP